jgi:nucleoid-associated protein YgaU
VLAQAPRLKAFNTAADPRALSAALMVGLILVIGFRHPVTRAIGTAGSPPSTLAEGSAARASTSSALVLPRQVPDTTPAVRLHAPRDPFAPLSKPISSPPVSAAAQAATTTTTGAATTSTSGDATSTYRVRPGDSLWAVARRTMAAPKTVAAIATAWQQIYADNRSVIGNDPGVLHVGVVLSLRSHSH